MTSIPRATTLTDANARAALNAQLIAACKASDSKLASEALASGANPSHLDPDDNPPLYWAIRSDSFECARILVHAGAKKTWSRQPPGHHSDSARINFSSSCFSIACGPRAHDIARLLLESGYAKFNSGSGSDAINSIHLTYPALRFLVDEAGVDPLSAHLESWAERENTAIFNDLLGSFGKKNAKHPNRLAVAAIKFGRGANLRLIANAFREHFEAARWSVEDDKERHDFVRFALVNARVFRSREARIFDTLDAFGAVAPNDCRAQILAELKDRRREAHSEHPPLTPHETQALQAALERIELGYHQISTSELASKKGAIKNAPRL